MNDLLGLMLLATLTAGLGAVLWWLLVATEGAYLGRRAVIWLYDLYAHRYDAIKHYQADFEHWLLAEPIMSALHPHRSPLVLDVATGTGRLPLALLEHAAFQGQIVALDLSRRMLRIAASKLAEGGERVSLIWGPAEELPFAEGTFDLVTCLESLEFMTRPEGVLEELARVLRPGGVMLISLRINTRAMPGKTWSDEQVTALLKGHRMARVEIEPWQFDYHKVWAIKAGESKPTGARPLDEILRCLRCPERLMVHQGPTWTCEGCQGAARVGNDGVIELVSFH